MIRKQSSQRKINAAILMLLIGVAGVLLIGYALSRSVLSKGPQVLFIGNSYTYTNDLPKIFTKLARSGGYAVDTGVLVDGGWTLAQHAQSDDTLEMLQQSAWDYVILQEQSVIPANPARREQSMYPAVRTLNGEIQNVGASTIMFITWGRRDGLSQLGYRNFSEMQNGLTRGNLNIAIELNILVSPVGSAWQNAINRDSQLALWQADGSHPSLIGSYLAACVFYAVIFGESPEGLAYMAGLDEDVGLLLQSVAAETVFK